MSTEYWWFMCSLNKEQEKKTIKIFEEKFKATKTNKLYFNDILQGNSIIDFRNGLISNNNLIAYDKFVSMFDIHEFHELGEKLIDDTSIFNENNCLKFITFNRCPPFGLVHYGLGVNKAQNIPGFRGNIFIKKTQIHESYSNVNVLFDEQEYESVKGRASKLVMNPSSLNQLDDVLRALPKCIRLAKSKNLGFLSVAMRGI
jgi:hypothetical protein